jgi:hypothetical protein
MDINLQQHDPDNLGKLLKAQRLQVELENIKTIWSMAITLAITVATGAFLYYAYKGLI